MAKHMRQYVGWKICVECIWKSTAPGVRESERKKKKERKKECEKRQHKKPKEKEKCDMLLDVTIHSEYICQNGIFTGII